MMLPGKGLTPLRSRRALLIPFIVMATGIGTLATASLATAAPSIAAPAVPASKPAVLAGSAAPKLPAGAVRDGVLAASQRLTVEVTLSPRNQAALTALLNGLADRRTRRTFTTS